MDRSRYKYMEYTDLAARFIETCGDWDESPPYWRRSTSAQYHFVLDFGSKQANVVCSEVQIEELLLPEGKESAEGVGLEDGTIRYLDLTKRDDALLSKIKEKSTAGLRDNEAREIWLVIFCRSMVRLGDYHQMGESKSSPAICKAREYVRNHGAGHFARIYYCSFLSRASDYIGPLVSKLASVASEWRVFEHGDSGFRIELPSQTVVSEEIEFDGVAEFKSIRFELSIEGVFISATWTDHLVGRDIDSAIKQFHSAIVETYNLPVINTHMFLCNGRPAGDLRIGQSGHYVSVRVIVASEGALITIFDSQSPLEHSSIARRVLESIAVR